MLESYRAWLASELQLLGNASHHAYSLGQANMAKRALEQFDEALHEETKPAFGPVSIGLGADEARAGIDALDAIGPLPPALAGLRSRLVEALGRIPETGSA